MQIPDLKSEIVDIKDFHYLVLPIINPALQSVDSFNVPDFHWDLYSNLENQVRLQLNVAPVGFAKSTILKIWGVKQLLERRDLFVLYVSSSYSKASDQFGSIKKILEEQDIQTIYEYNIVVSNEMEVVIEFRDGLRSKIQGIASGADISGINFEGVRPSLILIDDLEELDQAKSKDRTDKLQDWLFTTLISRLPSLVSGRVRMINTVLTLDSLTNRILGKAPNIDKNVFSDWDCNFYQALRDGKSIWGEVHPTEALLKEQQLRPTTFASNYMNEPLDSSDSLVRESDLRYYQYANLDEFESLYMHADLTTTANETSDFFCVTVLGESTKDKRLYLIDFILEKMDVEQQARVTIVLFMKYQLKIKNFTYDEKGNQGFGYWIKKLAREEYGISLPIKELKYPSDKVSHFLPHQPHFISNRVVLPSLHKDISIAVSQLTLFPSKSVNDDFVDGLSGVLDNFTIQDSFSFVV